MTKSDIAENIKAGTDLSKNISCSTTVLLPENDHTSEIWWR
jgi:hypothetical protein